MYAYIVNGQIQRAMVALPAELAGLTVAEQQAAGYYAIAGPAKPADDPAAGVAWVPTVEMVAGVPTVTWSQRGPLPDSVKDEVCRINRALASDPTAFFNDVKGINEFLADPDVDRIDKIDNSTALTTAQLNRALKAIIRQQRRQGNLSKRIAKLVVAIEHPEVFLYEV